MARRKLNQLTDRSIPALGAGLHADGNGLLLQVSPSEARSWILRTLIHSKRRDMGLGGWPTVSLKEARGEAQKYRAIARAGGDPFVERAKSKHQAPTFKLAAETVHSEHSVSWNNDKHRQQWINTLSQYAFPVLGSMRVDAIKSGDIMRVLGPIWVEKPETARRVLQRISAVLLWAKGRGFRLDNPSDEIAGARKALPKQKDKPKHHTALPHKEVASFITTMRGAGTSDQIKLAFELLILTATRTSEVLLATWEEIDLEERVWTIPASRMKSGREHRVPLSERCVEILMEASDERAGYVFPGTVYGKPLSNMVFLMTLRRMGLDITAHGFRSSFRDWCSEKTNAPRDVAEAALAHTVRDAVEAAYRRSDLFDRRRKLMEDWAAYATRRSADILKLA